MLRSFDEKHFSDVLSPASIEEPNEPVFSDQDQFVSVSITPVLCVCMYVQCVMVYIPFVGLCCSMYGTMPRNLQVMNSSPLLFIT